MSLIISILKVVVISYLIINVIYCVFLACLIINLMNNTGCTIKDAILAVKLWLQEHSSK